MRLLPLYYFHLRDGADILIDPEGRQLRDIAAAAAAALADARAIVSHEALAGLILLDKRIEVEDEAGTILHSLEFADAVAIVDSDRPMI